MKCKFSLQCECVPLLFFYAKSVVLPVFIEKHTLKIMVLQHLSNYFLILTFKNV